MGDLTVISSQNRAFLALLEPGMAAVSSSAAAGMPFMVSESQGRTVRFGAVRVGYPVR